MTTTLYLLTICLPLATVLAIAGMRYAAAGRKARAESAQSDEYRRLASASTAAQSQSAEALAAIQAAMADVKARLAAVETILKAVE